MFGNLIDGDIIEGENEEDIINGEDDEDEEEAEDDDEEEDDEEEDDDDDDDEDEEEVEDEEEAEDDDEEEDDEEEEDDDEEDGEDEEDEEDIIGSSDNGPAASVPHYLISLHVDKFKTIQTMVATGITFRQIIKSLASLRGTFRCEWMCGINSHLVQRYVRIICAINLQVLSGLMKQAYTYSIATDVGSVGNSDYMDLRVRLPTPSGSFINVHVLPIPLLSGKFIDIFSMIDFVFVNAMLEYLFNFLCFIIVIIIIILM
jgi:hypothetical protein